MTEGTAEATVRVLLVDDHQMFSDAIEILLRGVQGIEIVGSVTTGEDAIAAAEAGCPDVVLMDIHLPGIDGIEATRFIKERCPDSHVVVITALQQHELAARAVQAGASGFVPKTRAADDLLDVVRAAAAGEMVLPSSDIGAVLRALERTREVRTTEQVLVEQLTPREREVLQGFADGKSNDEVASTLFISPSTVQTHIRNILAKLGVRSKLEAVMFALRSGVITVSSEGRPS